MPVPLHMLQHTPHLLSFSKLARASVTNTMQVAQDPATPEQVTTEFGACWSGRSSGCRPPPSPLLHLKMAVSSAVLAFKQGLLRHVRLPLQQQSIFGSAAAAGTSLSLWRGYAGGGYLDKDDVTSRVLEVTKHFEKIDPAKVRPSGSVAASPRRALAPCCCVIWCCCVSLLPRCRAQQNTMPSRCRSTPCSCQSGFRGSD